MCQFLSRREFSKQIGVSLSTLNRGAKNNSWPFNSYVRLGGRVLYPESLLEELKGMALVKKGGKGSKND
jgi:hypothetical protein